MIHMSDDEILDLVDEDDHVIGKIARGDFKYAATTKGYIRVTDCFIVNSEGLLWIPRRTADKRLAPNGLDFSVGEHVSSGETYEQAMVRGFQEELNLDPDPRLLKLSHMARPSPEMRLFQAVYTYRSDETPNYNPADFTGFAWLHPEEVIAQVAAGDRAKQNLVPTIRRTFL